MSLFCIYIQERRELLLCFRHVFFQGDEVNGHNENDYNNLYDVNVYVFVVVDMSVGALNGATNVWVSC